MRVPMPFRTFERLPRHPDWRYEYWDGTAHLSHRPRSVGFERLAAAPITRDVADDVQVVPCSEVDPAAVTALLTNVWSDEEPYRCFDPDECAQILGAEVARSLEGGLPALGHAGLVRGQLIGAVLVTTAIRSATDRDQPELTWLTVRHEARSRGVATALLRGVCERLSADGRPRLHSACSAANVPSLRWHLSSGFTLAPDPLRTLRIGT